MSQTAAELEAARLAVRLEQTHDSFKRKITECALLRAEAQRRREEAESERAAARAQTARLRELEARFAGLGEHAHALLRNRERTLGRGPAVAALRRCYGEARREVAELRALLADQAVRLQDYRGKVRGGAPLGGREGPRTEVPPRMHEGRNICGARQ